MRRAGGLVNRGFSAVGLALTGTVRLDEPARRSVTTIEGTVLATYSYDANGNQSSVAQGATLVTMSYDMENRLRLHQSGASLPTYQYDGSDGLKRVEFVDGARTTLIWDGSDYLGEI